MWRYFSLFRYCLLNGGKWSSDLCQQKMLRAIEACSLQFASLNPFHSGSKTEARILCKSLSTVHILIRALCATHFNSVQEHTI